MTGVFGLVSSVGVLYQVIDIRRRSRPQADKVGGTSGEPLAWSAVPPQSRREETSTPAGSSRTLDHSAPTYAAESARTTGAVPTSISPINVEGSAVPTGTAGVPKVIARARKLILALTALTAVGCALLAYVGIAETTSGDASGNSLTGNLLLGIFMALVLALPLVAIQTVLSVQIGLRRNWARIAAIVMLACQALFCSCGGAVYATANLTTDVGESTLRPGIGTVTMGVVWLALGGLSIVASAMLLQPKSRSYFG